MSESLSAPYTIEFPFTRTVGPVIGAFFEGLREQRVLGARTASGRVLVPPLEYDPETSEPTGELVEVSPEGAVRTWTVVAAPSATDPLDRPFAWALVRLDGADTDLLHALDATDVGAGMRVRVRWAAERTGSIRDIECLEPA